ncbi:MAG: hypothetical protein HY060_25185 [Proteobacteria bacterium]|nr:hypothetical protein [Pseudomonadota bacterium]
MAQARLAHALQARGHGVFWISPSRRWSAWLAARGWPPDRVLNLPDFAARWRAMTLTDARQDLGGLERTDGLTIANIILMDRVLCRQPERLAYGFLAAIAQAIRSFLTERRIAACFGEATWAWEILTALVCRDLGRACLAVTTVRIPTDRFAFFVSPAHQIFEHRPATAADRTWATEFLATYRARPQPPSYARGQPTALRFRGYWLEELWRGLTKPADNRDDLTIWPLSARIAHRLRLATNAATLRLASPFDRARDLPADRRFVLFCLHHQPEASIDVVAALHSDQAAAIARLARLLPASHELWVKEHANGLGDRSRAWLRRLARLPGVRLIDPGDSTFALIRRADLVVSPAGTVAYEAALLGAPAATLADLYFTRLMSCHGDPLTWPLRQVLRTSSADDQSRLVDFLAWLHAQSFPGFPDRLAADAMRGELDQANQDLVLAGFERVLGALGERAAAMETTS